MIEYQVDQSWDTSCGERIARRRGRLSIDLPVSAFQTAYMSFNDAAQAFATSLSDSQHRKFAYQYFEYLQHIARGSQPPSRPHPHGNPNSRLVMVELERLFKSHFVRPEDLPS